MPATAVLSAALASRSERSPFLSSSFCFPRRIKKKGRKESVESGPRRPISDDDQISPIKPLIGVKSLIWSELHAGLDDYLLSDNKMRQCGNLILPVAPRIESHHSSRPFLFLHGRNDRVGSDDSSSNSSKQKQLRARKGRTRQIKNYIFVCTCFFYMLSNSLGENARETGSSSNNDRDSIPDLFIFKVSVYVQIGRRETGRKKKRRQGENLIKLMVSVVFTRSSDDFFFLSLLFFYLGGPVLHP